MDVQDQDSLPATKGDLRLTKGELRQEIGAVRDEVKAVRRDFALEIVKTNARIDRVEESLRGEIRAMHSDLTAKIDGFMLQVGKIDRAQIIADWRLTQLEKRPG